MILIGQYDSPFVRRVGIALTLFGIPFAHRPWSVFRDADRIAELNPVMKVPTLVLDDGTVLTDSHAMLDHLDHVVGPERALFPPSEPTRHRALRVATLACGAAEKAAALFYELRLHAEPSTTWVERCRRQVVETFARLERDRASSPGAWWFGDRFGNADIAVACCRRFVMEAHPGLVSDTDHPRLAADCARLEVLPVFREIAQPFVAPA